MIQARENKVWRYFLHPYGIWNLKHVLNLKLQLLFTSRDLQEIVVLPAFRYEKV